MIFVYRSHYDGPMSKRVRVRPDSSVLAWFQRGWYERDHDQWLETELGEDVYGLHSIFDAAREHDLAVPRTWDELLRLLREHLSVEGELRADDRNLRVLTDDDEVALAYFFFDDVAVAAAPDRTAYLVHPQWPLPAATTDGGGFTPPAPVAAAAPDAGGQGATYVVLLTNHAGHSIGSTPSQVFPGVRLPDLPSRLRAVEPTADWPKELRVLRARATDDSVEAALARANRWPLFALDQDPWPDDGAGVGAGIDVEAVLRKELPKSRDPDRSLITVDEHLAQLAMHVDEYFGYQQWYLFDDVWAASHPELAASLMRYAADWDPFG
jgi:hypothetical protein